MAGLKTFIRGTTELKAMMPGCANYDHHYGGCLFAERCKVEQGQRCGYFEQAVLPTAGQLRDGHKIIDEYQRTCQIKAPIGIRTTRAKFCACGATVPMGKQVCDKCRAKRRRQTQRKYMQKYRTRRCNTEVENRPLQTVDK